MPTKDKALIRLYFCDPFVITTQEYESIQKEVLSRAIAGDTMIGDQVLARLLHEMAPRYYEAKKINTRV